MNEQICTEFNYCPYNEEIIHDEYTKFQSLNCLFIDYFKALPNKYAVIVGYMKHTPESI